MGNFFIAIYNFFADRKWLLWLFTVAAFAFVAFFASRVQFEEDITQILPKDKKIEQLQQFLQNTKFADKLVVTLSLKDSTQTAEPDSLTSFAGSFAAAAEGSLKPYISKLQAQTDDGALLDIMQAIQQHLPVFLEEKDYSTIDSLITTDRLKASLEYDYNMLISPAGVVMKKIIQVDPVGMSWIGVKKLQQLQYDDHFEIYDNYIITKDHQHLMMFVTPTFPPNETGKNGVFLNELDQVIDSLQQAHPAVQASYFGATAVSVGNAKQLRQDTMLTQGITLVLLVVLIGLFFRKKRAPLLIMTPVVFGGLFALAVVFLLKGSISIIAMGAGCVVLGIAVNYSLHVFNHYRHLPDIRLVIKDLATPMTVGSFTTVGGFLCLQFVKSPMLKDVGFFAAFSLIGAALFSLIILPHFIVLGKQPQPVVANNHKENWLDRLSNYRPEKNKWIIRSIFVLTIIFFFTARNVSFESDMMRMNFMTPKLQQSEALLNKINAYTATSIYVMSNGNTLDAALQAREQMAPVVNELTAKGYVKTSSGVGALLLSKEEQTKRIARWNAYWTAEKKAQLMQAVRAEGNAYGFKPAAFNNFDQWLEKDFQVMNPETFDLFRNGFLNDFVNEKPNKSSIVTLLKVDPKEKQKVYAAIEKMPNTVVFDKQYTANRLVEVIQEEFNSIAWMTSLLVFIALLVSYGRIELALITFIPMVISWIWILGIMGLFGIKFNIVNIILSTFIFGLGDDYSIFTMDGLLQEYKTGGKHVSSFKSSIILSAITTILGLGVLIFAQHPSLRSIALISMIGIGCVVMTSQVLIPYLFSWLITNRVKKKKAPWKLWSWAKSVFSLTYFAVGSMIMTVIGWVLLKLNPFNKEKGRYYYHVWLSRFTWSTLHIMTNVKKRIINEPGEDFKKPAIIISNHQSFLDILVSTGMYPKLILLTNDWVWNSPIFGKVVRMAEYYPVADGAEGAVDMLRKKVEQGFSIVIYPEGTRSETTAIGRFHKGAFYLAEQLQLDILPVIIHGTAYTMSKNDFLLKDGTVTEKYLPRITPTDTTWGETYSARTKSISKYFKAEYQKVAEETEVPAYYREQLIYNYLYKGPVLEWYMRVKTRLEDNYTLFNNLVPKKGRIMDIGCGYGFMSYMLRFLSNDRIVTGIDYDEEKIATAANCYLRDDKINFIHANIIDHPFEEYDCFVIADVLHYLSPEDQETLLAKCLQHLSPNGVIILRDGDAELEGRHKGTKLTEFFSTKVLGFNKTQSGLHYVSASHIKNLVAKLGGTCEQIDNSKFTSNIIFVIKHSSIQHYA
ncbi:1-acyl-sn-glycerol-3-phosphate acyltransferase [Chitinophaga skermanii]|uniref:1-acyl-sn-glycerol-3-phosphate acyltransferase n=1 Tax=Chitinophaga skermanii TaxID=331697 RepID=A0A327QE65_9BACT|nr:trifunctional MMPL family transporter/lysophospholipid acyltransferase/class I SAM-dependent methyltransferase [Chitinophaga skermanii]RAJ02601.1 1-acyl-sn-glycerol-3-phosphate acyltransferase [Chitinophaga skermanii]